MHNIILRLTILPKFRRLIKKIPQNTKVLFRAKISWPPPCLCDNGRDVHDAAQVEHDVLAEVGLLGAPGGPGVEPAVLRRPLVPFRARCHVGPKQEIRHIDILKAECFGSVFIWFGSGSSILGRTPTRLQGFDDQKFQKIFWIKRQKLQFTNLRPSYRRRLPLSKRTSGTVQHFETWHFLIFFFFCGKFFLSSIRIPNPDMDALTWLNRDPKTLLKRREF